MRIAIYGLGLIGGSLGRAIIKKTNHIVFGYDIDGDTLIKAKMLNAIHEEINEENIANVDLVIVATNPKVSINILDEIVPKLAPNTIVIDCAGNKVKIVDKLSELSKVYPKLEFIGIHPMAGREFSGINHAISGMFERSYFIMVPINNPIEILAQLKSLFIQLGAIDVLITNAEKHDQIIAYTSQLAHIVSSAYIMNPLSAKHIGFSAGSFRDMTRVAKLNPSMWTELMIDNSANIVKQIDDLVERLGDYREALENNDEQSLYKLLEKGNNMKYIAEQARKQGVNNDN